MSEATESPAIHCTFDKLVEIEALRPHPKNRNKHPKDQIERLAQILRYQGFRYPVKVSNLSGFVTSGHGRIEAARENGWTHVPVNFQDYKDEAQEYADLQADNAIASWAELDLSGINGDIGDFGPDFDIDLLGIKNFSIEVADPGHDEADDVPGPPVEPVTKRGDLYLLGKHRLLCGDSTSIDDVVKLMGGELADMVWTDPPYNVAYEGKTKDAMTIENDSMDDEKFYQFLYDAYSNMLICTRAGGGNLRRSRRQRGRELPQGHEGRWLAPEAVPRVGETDVRYGPSGLPLAARAYPLRMASWCGSQLAFGPEAIDGHQLRQAEQKRRTPHYEAGGSRRVHDEEQQRSWGARARPLRRQRDDHHRRGEVRQTSQCHGAGSQVLRRHREALGELHRAEG